MSKYIFGLALAFVMTFSSVAYARTYYHVYKKKGTSKCEITMRNPKAFRSAKGSSWKFIGKSTTRSGAKKIYRGAGCR